jgi:hypothetical protein
MAKEKQNVVAVLEAWIEALGDSDLDQTIGITIDAPPLPSSMEACDAFKKEGVFRLRQIRLLLEEVLEEVKALVENQRESS